MASVEPTLDDGAVMEFVASGYVLLEGVIDDSFNQRCDDLNPGNIDAFIASDAFRKVTNWGKEEILAGRPHHEVYGG